MFPVSAYPILFGTLIVLLCSRLLLRGIINSPLRHIPGPPIAAVTFWYEIFYDVFRPGKYVFKIKELHEQYGPVIRINPREISVSDLSALDVIYDPKHGAHRNKDAVKLMAINVNQSVGGAWQHDLHRLRRQSLNVFFSQRAVMKMEAELKEETGKLGRMFGQACKDRKPINLSDMYFGFSNDIVRQYAFGHNGDLLSQPNASNAARRNVASVLRQTKVNISFPWISRLMRRLPRSIALRFTPRGVADLVRFRMEVQRDVQQVMADDENVHRISAGRPTIFYELRDSTVLPESEKSIPRLVDEGVLLVMAGTESTAKSITIAHFYLTKLPAVMSELRDELQSHPDADLRELLQLPYLNGIIQEAHRLSFGITGRNPRVSPDAPMVLNVTHGDTIKTYTIPAGTPVSMSSLDAHTNETLFPDPWRFDPTRWIKSPENDASILEARREAMISYGKGPRICVGRNLANSAMAMCIAKAARWEMQLFDTDEDDVRFQHDYHVSSARLDSVGVRVKVIGTV